MTKNSKNDDEEYSEESEVESEEEEEENWSDEESPVKKKAKSVKKKVVVSTDDDDGTYDEESPVKQKAKSVKKKLVDSTIHDDDNDDEDVLESFEERFPNYVFDDFDDEDETEEDNLKSVGDESRIKQNKEDLAKFLGLECISNDTHSNFDGRRNLPEDLLSKCLEWFASLPEIFKQSIISANPAQPHTVFLVEDAHRIFPDLDIKSLTNVQLYDLPCYGKFPSQTKMLATIGGRRPALDEYKTLATRRDEFIVTRWMPSEEGVPPWNEIHVVENAAEKIELMKTEIVKRLKLEKSLLQHALVDSGKHNFQKSECRMRNGEREAENYANGTSNIQRQEVIEKANKRSSELAREKFRNGTHNFQKAKKESRAAATGGTGLWTDEEDMKLTMLVRKHGLVYGTWVKIAKEIPGECSLPSR